MCGIAGFIDTSLRIGNDQSNDIIIRMTDNICHRGPDDSGVWVDAESGIAMGHRRLSIIDLSKEGHQPMHSACGRYVIVFNGEIYNFRELRRDLEKLGYPFRSHSDTEVMLAAISQWGIDLSVERFVGMFAFAIWDRMERILYLVRDRLGIKPLYYGWVGKIFVFGSELKAVKSYPGFKDEIDRNAIALMMRYNYIPAPYSIYEGIFKLMPATIVTVGGEKTSWDESSLCPPSVNFRTYWSAREVAERGIVDTLSGSEEEAIKQLEEILCDAIRLRMVADVPLGAFFSGGIDSSTVVALMQSQSTRPIKTFSIGFAIEGYNEAIYAKEVARHLGTEHTELYITPEEALAVIPRLPAIYDEPFSDVSQIPTFLVSQLAREHVTVVLSGDGGDELFGGYTRYFWGRSIWQKTRWMRPELQRACTFLLTSLSTETWDRIFKRLTPVLPHKMRLSAPGDKLHKLAEVIGGKTPEDMYHRLISYWKEPTKIVIGALEPDTVVTDREKWAKLPDFIQRMMYLDMVSYLPDDILTKVDRASMAVSLEARVPLLDHRVVEFASKLPLSMKINNGKGKWLLRQMLYRHVPQELIDRPKMGFGVPIDNWLRGPLRGWAENLLSKKRLKEEGFFNHEPIHEKWLEHISGKRNWQYYLWNVLMFQAWYAENKSSA